MGYTTFVTSDVDADFEAKKAEFDHVLLKAKRAGTDCKYTENTTYAYEKTKEGGTAKIVPTVTKLYKYDVASLNSLLGDEVNYTFTSKIPYGAGTTQYVNLYVPFTDTLDIVGMVMYINPHSWNSGVEDPFPTTTATQICGDLANSGYIVVEANFTAGFPACLTDVQLILKHILAANTFVRFNATKWAPIVTYGTQYKLVVAGTGSGGHLALMGTCENGLDINKWPAAVHCIAPIMDLNTGTFIDPIIRAQIDLAIPVGSRAAASPITKYGTSGSPGTWFSAVNATSCKFYFTVNENDTLVTAAISGPGIQNMVTSNGSKTIVETVKEGAPLGLFAGTSPVTSKGSLASTSLLPKTGNTAGDLYTIVVDGETQYWVYNNGSYKGDSFNEKSINGFTRWFVNNFTVDELDRIIAVCEKVNQV